MTEAMHGIAPVMVPAAARTGAAARIVAIRAVPTADQSSTAITGLPAESAWTTRDRLFAAIGNSPGCFWPRQPLTLSVEPDVLPAGDSGLDLPFAVALLAASGQIPAHCLAGTLFLGELGLDGALRPVSQMTARLAAVTHAGTWSSRLATSPRPPSRPAAGCPWPVPSPPWSPACAATHR